MESQYAVGLSKKAIDIYKLLISSQPLSRYSGQPLVIQSESS
jgi:hypothetical protein